MGQNKDIDNLLLKFTLVTIFISCVFYAFLGFMFEVLSLPLLLTSWVLSGLLYLFIFTTIVFLIMGLIRVIRLMDRFITWLINNITF